MALSLLVVSISFYLKEYISPDSDLYATLSLVSVAGVVVMVIAFSLGLGAMPWIIMSEILPINIKRLAGSFATLANWFFSWLVTLTANLLLDWSSGGKPEVQSQDQGNDGRSGVKQGQARFCGILDRVLKKMPKANSSSKTAVLWQGNPFFTVVLCRFLGVALWWESKGFLAAGCCEECSQSQMPIAVSSFAGCGDRIFQMQNKMAKSESALVQLQLVMLLCYV
ncbi:hypothetical protein KIW84_063937 [Lathyrus oleraceus]|uniref:Major facilitator superfamily (MFS) profile domain-containing protein n=1 Tax=Pisum sativum TaxID=3888 RepID=A0A9D4W8X3_PEA|nr:hypothetical protein KIW84_063937 [Pisum sativum]